jgi:hypothetical protein
LIADENELVRRLLMSGGGMWIKIEVLPIRLRVLLPMPMKEDLRTAADETGSVLMEET